LIYCININVAVANALFICCR